MKGIISLGEALIDFIPLDQHNLTYQKSPGGAPANVAVALARLGLPSTFLGKVGDDVLGRFLKETLKSYGVGVEHMTYTTEARTGVVFVTLDKSGERSFSFYINPSADRFLHKDDLSPALFKQHNLLHFGSISMIGEPAKEATQKAVQLAKQAGMLISYDPNLRLGLWPSEELARQTITSMLSTADILKISDEELTFITGEVDLNKGLAALSSYDIPLIFVTYGEKGSYFQWQQEVVFVPAILVETVDTTGAGDAFVSGILYSLSTSNQPFSTLKVDEVKQMAKIASLCGGLAASKKGAMTALPTLHELKAVLN